MVIGFIVYLLLKNRPIRHEHAVPPEIRMGLLSLIIPLVLMMLIANTESTPHQIVIKLTAEQATKEIATIQQSMQDEACNFWDLSRHYKYRLKHEGHNAITLACALSKLNITCPCDTSEEIVPVVSQNKLKHVEDYPNVNCPATDKIIQYQSQLDMFETAATYLCEKSDVDNWSRDEHGQLIASGCIVAKKGFNCHCHGSRPHKNIFRDLLTIGATQSNLTSRITECEKMEKQMFENRAIEYNTIYAQFRDKSRRHSGTM